MLEMTPVAAAAIRQLVSATAPVDDAGLRFSLKAADNGQSALEAAVASAPEQGDEVVTDEQSGARVFLDSQASQYLNDMVLDVQEDEEGRPSFAIGRRAG
ncbi:MAG TPA: iron-sulfur cluster biosynthesis protein [Pseudonocardiaceae bacterium]|jgi:iron-sulfur cluster assembly protein|nr:iron-sulfur cluster biosynthesis protein [Pseudonocardiaceae bacterium]